jgi:hypothetical protein
MYNPREYTSDGDEKKGRCPTVFYIIIFETGASLDRAGRYEYSIER